MNVKVDQTLIDKINNVIVWAILHGGDPGGPYFVEKEMLAEKVSDLCGYLDCDFKWMQNFCPDDDGEWEPDESEEDYPILLMKEPNNEEGEEK